MTVESAETVAFGRLQITFDGRVLRPRSWTEAQSAWAAEILRTAPAGQVLELCAGAGHIGLLAVLGSTRCLLCVDIDPVACEFARRNAEAAGMTSRVEVREGAMDEVLRDGERFAVVIADPPWVPRASVGRYPEDPLLAIDGGPDGLEVARECIAVAERCLAPSGVTILQLGTTDQADTLSAEPGHGSLCVTEVREYPGRGVLALLEQTGASS